MSSTNYHATCVRCGIAVYNPGSSCRDCQASDPYYTRVMVAAAKAELAHIKNRSAA